MSTSEQTSASKREPKFKAGDLCLAWHLNQYDKVDLFYCKLESVGDEYATGELFFDEKMTVKGGRRTDICVSDLSLWPNAPIERPSPQQQPDTTLDNPNLEQLIKAMFPAHNYGTSNKQKVANATSTAGQPDELSKAQARIRELEAENEQLRSERDKMKEENERLKQELQDEKDYLHGIIKQTEQDAAREIDKYRP